jgi:protein TonB
VEPPAPARRRIEVEPVDLPEPPPEDPARPKAPPRVVGLDLDSTVVGGDGPTYATGDTRAGRTAERASAPRRAEPAPPPRRPSEPTPPGANKAATRLPTAGAKYVLPKRKRPARPVYPEMLKSQGIEANVTVIVSLDAEGKVTSVKIAKGSEYPEFDEAARQAALAEEFSPATRDGAPIAYTLSFTYRFRLDD